MKERLFTLGLVLLFAGAADVMSACAQTGAASADPGVTPQAGTAWVIFGSDTVVAEIASTAAERSRGLSNRDSVPPGTGMLFVFDRTEERTFWMKDTFVDLDIAFFDERYVVREILHLEAESMELRDSSVPVFMALEVPGGWFEEHGIAVGSTAEIVFGGMR